MSKIGIVFHSGYGHTKVVAEEVAQGAREAGAEAELHEVTAGQTDFTAMLEALDRADAIVFGSPTYMGSASGPMKMFMDATSAVWQRQGWRDKLAAGFTNSLSLSGDKLNTLVQFAVLAAQLGMIWVGTGTMPGNLNGNSTAAPDVENRIGSSLGVMTQSDNAAPDVTPPPGDRATARAFGRRIAEAAGRWSRPA